jgi:hypothetical protein
MEKPTTYIGVRGHRGAGKPTVSFLLAGTIEWYIEKRSFDEEFEEYYQSLVDDIVNNPDDFICSRQFDYVYLESFSDTQRVMCSMLLGIDIDCFYSEYHKDHLKVHLSDLSVSNVECGDELVTAESLLLARYSGPYSNDLYMSLREFCSYYSLGMQKLMGDEIWIHSLEKSDTSSSEYGTPFKIFYDVKLPSEVTHIIERDGYIVRVLRPKHKKKDTTLSSKLDGDERVNFEVLIDGDDMVSCKEDLKEIVQVIVDGRTAFD